MSMKDRLIQDNLQVLPIYECRPRYFYSGYGTSIRGMVLLFGAWYFYSGHGTFIQDMVPLFRAWYLYSGHGTYIQGMVLIFGA